MSKTYARIRSVAHYTPPRVVKNTDLEKLMDTSDEWIFQRSGIKERRYAEESDTCSSLGLEAAKKALIKAKLKPEDLDLILVATLTPDHFFPGNSVFIQNSLGLHSTPAMDIRCQCPGFIYGLATARAFIESGQYKRVLVVGTELHSKALDFSTEGRDVTVLFGDGAGAAIIEASPAPEYGILSTHLYSEGEHANKLWIESPGVATPRMIEKSYLDERKHFPYMEGRYVFKHAVTRVSECVNVALEANRVDVDDVDLFVFHQANRRINETVADMLKIPSHKTFHNIEKYGNCSAASIPICLSECVEQGLIKPGSLVCLAAFGSGFNWASSMIRW